MSVTAGLLRIEAGMSYNPAQGFPRIMPSLRYEDLGKALAWLLSFVLVWGFVFLLFHLVFYPFPDITRILNPTGQ